MIKFASGINLMEYNLTIKKFINNISTQGSLLGVDYGKRRIGLSISDITRKFVSPVGTLDNKNIEDSLLAIIELIKNKNISGVIIGYPLQLDGTEGQQCQEVKKFAKSLLQKQPIPIFFQDERFSTREAQTILKNLNMKRKRRDQKDNEVAAYNILKTALQLLNNHLNF
ncbi:MAG: Holliday junction resolvase RuvX [Rickettsiales bacterium]|nr:Holliday junction resolvase RuvX [Rickettsiales bacterium]